MGLGQCSRLSPPHLMMAHVSTAKFSCVCVFCLTVFVFSDFVDLFGSLSCLVMFLCSKIILVFVVVFGLFSD